VAVTQAGVPAVETATVFQTYVENGTTIRSGIAIANPSSRTASVSLELAGRTSALEIPPNGQTAMFLNEMPVFAGLPVFFQGVLRITSDNPIAVTGLRGHTNERGEFLITATPPVTASAAVAGSNLFFPHFADGGGYTVQFVLFGGSTSGTIDFLDPAGNPAPLQFQ
jgi:hypothetical protein